jgi:hypothetical protein
VWSCRDFTEDVLHGRAEVEGHEEVCLFDVVSPSAGAPLTSSMMHTASARAANLRLQVY